MQLIQQYVQKSRRTILPLSCAIVTGLSVLNQPTPPSSSGALCDWGLAPPSSHSEAARIPAATPAYLTALVMMNLRRTETIILHKYYGWGLLPFRSRRRRLEDRLEHRAQLAGLEARRPHDRRPLRDDRPV